jgi:serine/threonine-protein kinase
MPLMPLTAGQTFAGYRIVRLLGSGGMGEVYLAEHPRLPRQDALKVLPADLSVDPDYCDRFNREADLASKLWHPHIVRVHDRGEYNGQLWIAMDYVDGLDAGRLLSSRYPDGLPADQVVRIVTAVASALDYAHKQGLLHRDVKPANIMLTHVDVEEDEERVLLADFGIARNVDDISGLTVTNMTVGTVAYSAPEQLMGEEVDGRADQYALAATAYHLLSGRQLFPHTNPTVVISRHLNATPPALADTRPELATFDAVLAVALAKDPNDRFIRCADFARALERAATPGSTSATAPTAAAPTAGKPNQHASVRRPHQRWLLPAAVLTASILIAALALTLRPWHRGHPTTTAPTTAAISAPAASTRSAAVTPPPAPTPTSAAPAATKVVTVAAVVDGQPANGYSEGPSRNNVLEVFYCDASPAAVGSRIYRCAPSAAAADVCWPSTPGTLLCLFNPWDKRVYREFYRDTLPLVEPPATPEPFALVLDDGTQCRLRNGGAWGGRDDNYVGAYGCQGNNVLVPGQSTAPAEDRSHPLWTVKIGPLGSTDEHFPPPEIHTVTTAYFAGN